ncbi:hypothetical protein QBC41DRAFT_310022 [Cercophora samala]|uniref:Uncharacterized protein n=1 Tax=Cercophora samala TaxID=330535 RepID=A0AA39ZNC8_9PEZI|nr:hypothetical protein QBC41DRAFT_310022 [Cercophora samala]
MKGRKEGESHYYCMGVLGCTFSFLAYLGDTTDYGRIFAFFLFWSVAIVGLFGYPTLFCL